MPRSLLRGSLLISALCAFTFAHFQKTIGTAQFEFGKIRKFEGILNKHPYPNLSVNIIGHTDFENNHNRYYLVAPYKFGLSEEICGKFDTKKVSLDGTLIYRNDQTMIETAPDSIKQIDSDKISHRASIIKSLGNHTFSGEIIDSKCFFGVMNPGRLKTHRACAIRCISGGIPPVLLVEGENFEKHHYLLVGKNGETINKRVLNFIAESVKITGEVVQYDNLRVLKADPDTFKRLY